MSPNTLDAHRVIRWASEAGRQGDVVEALFRAYFIEGRNVGDPAVLADIAAAHGLDRDDIAARLASGEDREAVREEIEAAQRIGVTGVPTFILAGRYGARRRAAGGGDRLGTEGHRRAPARRRRPRPNS